MLAGDLLKGTATADKAIVANGLLVIKGVKSSTPAKGMLTERPPSRRKRLPLGDQGRVEDAQSFSGIREEAGLRVER